MIGRPFRFIADDGEREPRRNLAIDEALARTTGPEPILRLWRNDRCVVLGRFQVAAAEVDLIEAERLGAPVCRRFSGGGAVYHDSGNLNVSLAAPRDHAFVADRVGGGLAGLYGAVLEPLAVAAQGLGIPALTARRGLFVDDRKLGGVAAWVGGRRILVHATLLIDADLEALRRVLAGPGDPGNARWERTKSERVPVTSLARELDGRALRGGGSTGRRAFHAVVDRAVVEAFTAARGRGERPIEADRLRASELAVAADLFLRRYADPNWHASGRLAEWEVSG